MTDAGLPAGERRPMPERTTVLIQLHIAEYQALTTRATYFITLMGTVWPVLLIFFGLLVQGQLWTVVPAPILLLG